MKRALTFLLSIVMIVSMIPAGLFSVQRVHAADEFHYILDTDGIDPSSVYLIVSQSSDGTASALRNNDGSVTGQSVTISNGKIETVDNESNCLWTFSGNSSGTIRNESHYISVNWRSVSLTTSSTTLKFSHFGSGKYGIYTSGTYGSMLNYLRYNNGWTSGTNWNGNGTSESSYSSFVYLFKQVTSTFTVSYDGNGATGGEVPDSVTDLKENATVTVSDPGSLTRELDGDSYVFTEWNTLPDGTGTSYNPGDTINVTDDITLYAQWMVQPKYKITVTANLDDVPTNIEDLHGTSAALYVRKSDGTDYIPLHKIRTGVYECSVTENGDYYVYIGESDGHYHEAHGHMVSIYNQDGNTTLQNYSVTYNTGAEAFGSGTPSWKEVFHANNSASVSTQKPLREQHRFTGWKWGNLLLQPGDPITNAMIQPITLEAQWIEAIDLTVHITVRHAVGEDLSSGFDTSSDKHQLTFQLMKQTDSGLYLPVGSEVTLSEDDPDANYTYNEETQTTTYTYTFHGLEEGIYTISTQKDGYASAVTSGSEAYILNLAYQFQPDNFDLEFKVQLENGASIDSSLLPKAVNVKVSCWGYSKDEELGWHIITQQDGKSPTTVLLDKDGSGTGKYSVWKYWSVEADEPGNANAKSTQPYFYRVEITSFVLPDGSIVAASSNDKIRYTLEGSNLYTADVSLDNGGSVPNYPADSTTSLSGAFYSGEGQSGIPTVTYAVSPFTVRFDANGGTLNGQDTVTFENQYRYPNLLEYNPEPPADQPNATFAHWHIGTEPAENKNSQFLNENITYTAHWHPARTVSGTIHVNGSYTLDGEELDVYLADRAAAVKVVIQRETNGAWNDIASQLVQFDKDSDYMAKPLVDGELPYCIKYPNDGFSNYRLLILELNYTSTFDNNGDSNYTAGEDLIPAGDDDVTVNAHLAFNPQTYTQLLFVDATQIHKDFRPENVLAQIAYRNMGSSDKFEIITQHGSGTMGVPMVLTDGRSYGSDDIWNWHTDGLLYEYQIKLSKLYGNVSGVFSTEGSEYDPYAVPYTVEYGNTAWFDNLNQTQSSTLTATLIPDTYHIYFMLGSNETETFDVLGMEEFITDTLSGNNLYCASYRWSYGTNLVAFPYRDGYVFKGWKVVNGNANDAALQEKIITNDGYISIPADTAQDIILQAQWEALTLDENQKCYTIRYLERHTDKVLHGATVVSAGIAEGSTVAVNALSLPVLDGYVYCGASIGGTYYDKAQNPVLTISADNKQNLLVIYYEPDGSSGYTDQVESNLHLDKSAILEDNGTYTIHMQTYTTDNPITTQILKNTPLDIVLVLDQSGSIINSGYLDELKESVSSFISMIADHGREHEVDHRIALVGYAGNATEAPTNTNTSQHPIAGGNTKEWVNTGVFDSNGDFHPYPVTGFNYTAFTGNPDASGTYYTKSGNEYLLLMHHDTYYHMISEREARTALLNGTTVYGYADGKFVELTRNTSGLWLYGDKLLYSLPEFFTYHTDVWTHREGLQNRQIHGYGTGANYKSSDGHEGLYTRAETTNASPQLNVYKDALVPVSIGGKGSGNVNPSLIKSAGKLGSNGGTFVQYGIEMANRVFEANPLTPGEGRVRIMIMFTDGLPGIGTFSQQEADAAIAHAYTSKNTYGAHAYTIGLYKSESVDSTNKVSLYMNAVSSNYPHAQSMEDIFTVGDAYTTARSSQLKDGRHYFIKSGNQYYPLCYGIPQGGSSHVWYYVNESTGAYTTVSTNSDVTTNSSGRIGNSYTVYVNTAISYANAENTNHYSTTESVAELKKYFAQVMEEITTKITTKIVLHEDTILRDIMGQGFKLTEGTVITARRQKGTYIDEDTIEWGDFVGDPISLTLTSKHFVDGTAYSEQTALVNGVETPWIQVYNLNAENTTDPTSNNYSPHTVDITGYDFNVGYINANHKEGYRLVAEITRVEAQDNVVWGRSTKTNNDVSGLWLPKDASGSRTLLLPFKQPNTIFVERAYVLDYAKAFTLSGWYFDPEDGKPAAAVHVDTNLTNGMNWFDENDPNTSSGKNGRYGNITVTDDGKVEYTPTTMSWGGYDQFYIFGDTWRTTVKSQSANENGNLWVKVSVIPANNVYYEDSFITTPDDSENGIDGFVFTGSWSTATEGNNTELPEHMENKPYGDVHGWVDSMGDDITFTDGTVAGTTTAGSSSQFTFTGTGVDVYTRTNNESGIVVAVLTKIEDQNTEIFKKTIVMDNHAKSGDYYHIPTISFHNLEYGTYKVKLIATMASAAATGTTRSEYYLDGIRVYNPLGSDQTKADDTVTDAYGNELNAVFTEIRKILLDYKEFNVDMEDDTVGKAGAVFIDWIRDGQGTGTDPDGEQVGKPSYEIGTFTAYGPKNEVYLSPGQSIVLKVDPANHYYVGMKWLRDVSAQNSTAGKAVKVLVSGITKANPTTITFAHTSDMYYQVTPIDGYIVIENASENGEILSLTKLRTTSLDKPANNGGVLPITQTQALMFMSRFASMQSTPDDPDNGQTNVPGGTTDPEPTPPPVVTPSINEQLAEQLRLFVEKLFGSMRSWLHS